MAFDVSTVTYKGAELLASATSGNKLVLAGCDAFTNSYTDVQAAAVTTRVSSPMTTSTDVTLIGSAQNHVMARSVFEGGVTTGGSARTLMLFGHTENDPSNDYVIAVVSSNSDFHLPDASDAITTFETLFDISYNVPDSSVITTSTALFATLAEFNDLKSRAVIAHNQGDLTHGPIQDIYGVKRFRDILMSYDTERMFTTIEDENDFGWINKTLELEYEEGNTDPIYVYDVKMIGDNGSYARIVLESRNTQEIDHNEDGSGIVTLYGHRCTFNSAFVDVKAQLNVKRVIKFDNFPNDTHARLGVAIDNVNGGGLLKLSNLDNFGNSVNDVIVGNDGLNPPYFEVSTSDIRFVKNPNSTVSDSDLKFSIGPFNTETFGEVHFYNLSSNERRAYGFNRMSSSFQGQLIRYQIGLSDAADDTTLALINIQHRDTWDQAIINMRCSQVTFDCDNLYPSSAEGVDTYIGSSSTPFKRGYFGILYSTDALINNIETDKIFNELGLRIEWGESRNAFIKMEQIDSESDKLTVAVNQIILDAENGTSNNKIDIDSRFSLNIYGHINNSDGSMLCGDLNAESLTISGDVSSNMIPDINNSKDLGSSSKRWATIYGVGVECEAVICNTVYGDLSGCIPFSGDGTTSVLLKAGTIGLFFISTSVLGGDTVWNPGKHVSFSNAGNNKIFFAVNRNFTVSSVNLAGFQRDTQTTISANTVHLVLLSSLYGDTSNSNSFNLALCMITADQG